MRLRILVSVLLLSGCAQQVWTHSYKGQQEFYQENSQCMAMAGGGAATQVAPSSNAFLSGFNQGAAIASVANRDTIYKQCMMGNGWFLTRKN